jgi:hypothetical protein
MAWVPLRHHDVTRESALVLLRAGLGPDEAVDHAAMGQELPTSRGLRKAARDAGERVRAIDPAKVIATTALFGAVLAVDGALHAIGADHGTSISDAFERPGTGRHVTRAGVVLLDVLRALVDEKGGARSYAAVRAAFVWPRPAPATVTMQERRVLCVETVSLRFADAEGQRHVGFLEAHGFPDNRAEAKRIARALR